MRARCCAAFLFAALTPFWLAAQASAGTATSITGLYRTGQESTPEWFWGVDNHWTSSNASGEAYVVGLFLPGSWATSSSAKWISANVFGSPGTSVDYSYALTFDIAGTGTGATSNASITLTLYVDDTAIIYVNGVQTAVVNGSNLNSTPTTLTLNSNFVIGSNTISIAVHNVAGSSGLMVSSISGVVPEVGAWVPLAGTLLLYGWLRLRRKKKFPLAA
ncbi:MAG: hypothetical protein QM715_09035 [Nibricoccus sp.]